jgi:hypothetical protein
MAPAPGTSATPATASATPGVAATPPSTATAFPAATPMTSAMPGAGELADGIRLVVDEVEIPAAKILAHTTRLRDGKFRFDVAAAPGSDEYVIGLVAEPKDAAAIPSPAFDHTAFTDAAASIFSAGGAPYSGRVFVGTADEPTSKKSQTLTFSADGTRSKGHLDFFPRLNGTTDQTKHVVVDWNLPFSR